MYGILPLDCGVGMSFGQVWYCFDACTEHALF